MCTNKRKEEKDKYAWKDKYVWEDEYAREDFLVKRIWLHERIHLNNKKEVVTIHALLVDIYKYTVKNILYFRIYRNW